MDEVRALLETQPLLTLFLTIALGYVVGELSIKGVSLGSGRRSLRGTGDRRIRTQSRRHPPFSEPLACCYSFTASASSTAHSFSRA